jgi:putative phosphoribosyl transferase
MPFGNRSEAGRSLAAALAGYKEQEPTILALPRGGVLVAAEVAAALDAPLDLILVRKVGVPFQPALAMGAVADGGGSIIVRNEDVIERVGINERDSKPLAMPNSSKSTGGAGAYLGNREGANVTGRTAIVIDRRLRRRKTWPRKAICPATVPSAPKADVGPLAFMSTLGGVLINASRYPLPG